ncbi:ribonuclease Z [Nitrospirota bacterium]
MKPTFHHKLVNGPYEDPVLYVRLFREKRALMFDCGDITPLSLSQMLRVSDLFITHTHIDHFIGFDRILRSVLSRERPLRIFGPANIIDAVEGKLRGYSWNLIKGYPMELEVNAISGDMIKRAAFRAASGLIREEMESIPFDGTLLQEPSFRIRAVELDHEIPCLAYSLEEEFHINIIKTALDNMGLMVGSWLRDLKQAIWENRPGSSEIETGGGIRRIDELRKAARITDGQKLAYVTDATPTKENIGKAAELARGATSLYCEAFFMSHETERALDRNHLTSAETAEIARRSGSRELIPMHYSSKYKGSDKDPGQEALELFMRE